MHNYYGEQACDLPARNAMHLQSHILAVVIILQQRRRLHILVDSMLTPPS